MISIIMWVRGLKQMGLSFADHCCRVSKMGREHKFIRYTDKHIYTERHTQPCTNIRTYIYTYTLMYTHMHIYIYTQTHIHI